MFCQQRFSLADGATSACESWRAIDRQHVERRTATPEQHARMKIDHRMIDDDGNLTIPLVKPIPALEIAHNRAGKLEPTPFDAAALRAGKPTTPQPGLF